MGWEERHPPPSDVSLSLGPGLLLGLQYGVSVRRAEGERGREAFFEEDSCVL